MRSDHIVARDGESWLIVAERYEQGCVVIARSDHQEDANTIVDWLNFPVERLRGLLGGVVHLPDQAAGLPAAGVQSHLEGLAVAAQELQGYLRRFGEPEEDAGSSRGSAS